jgi:hypothetical protein
MRKRVYYALAVAILIGMAGLVGAQITGTKPATEGVSVAEKEAPPMTVEERIMNLTKNQEKILAELKVIRENQAQILEQGKKIFTRMKKK